MKRFLSFLCIAFLIISCSEDDSSNPTNSGPDVTANQQALGSSSLDLLSDDEFTSMVVELVYVEGFEPTQTAINNFKTFLEDRTHKPDGIVIESRSIPSPGFSPYTTAEIVDIENDNRTKFNNGSQIAVWAFFADGNAEGDTSNQFTLGTAYRNTSFVIYENTIQDLSGGLSQPSQSVLETAVIHHEFAHIFGLVNIDLPMQTPHEDADSDRHCNVDGCLMQANAETGSGMMGTVSGGTIPTLDDLCIADLQANGGK
ncbi:membrane metalloprotease [Winogradskyella maritima]|uniref:Membrane metalloprotease n=1 Tax=Winogradskyella maritima TaxID=1517766 RepID=A0ABV8AL07_9FLAO|nr:membrane metalloprotease [Winogradskyella maritima]